MNSIDVLEDNSGIPFLERIFQKVKEESNREYNKTETDTKKCVQLFLDRFKSFGFEWIPIPNSNGKYPNLIKNSTLTGQVVCSEHTNPRWLAINANAEKINDRVSFYVSYARNNKGGFILLGWAFPGQLTWYPAASSWKDPTHRVEVDDLQPPDSLIEMLHSYHENGTLYFYENFIQWCQWCENNYVRTYAVI